MPETSVFSRVRGQFRPEGVARDMIRISTIFIAICMVLVAASLGLVLHSVAGISGTESAIVALTALTFLILYNAVSMRLRDRSDVGGQIADLSRGTADLARQVAEFGRRLAAVEGRVVSANSPAPTASRPSSARSTNSAAGQAARHLGREP
jgi:cyclic-di-GMP phosphodiesterase TipF (flagellum assembly factor)